MSLGAGGKGRREEKLRMWNPVRKNVFGRKIRVIQCYNEPSDDNITATKDG
jgi:hypothetical protein